MFKRFDVYLTNNPLCEKPVSDLEYKDFRYYDVDGFELNSAEQKFYHAMKYPIDAPILNHCCWQEPWFELEDTSSGLMIDHAMFLCRSAYAGAALEQLKELKSTIPLADCLIRTKTKWGFDFSLFAIREDRVFEVVHIEYDSRDYEHFVNKFVHFDFTVRHTDWNNAADRVWAQRDQWQQLVGFDQNHWKAQYLLGWKQSEYTEKAL